MLRDINIYKWHFATNETAALNPCINAFATMLCCV